MRSTSTAFAIISALVLLATPLVSAEPRTEERRYVSTGAPTPCIVGSGDLWFGCVPFDVASDDQQVRLVVEDLWFGAVCFGVQVSYADGTTENTFGHYGSATIALREGADKVRVYLGAESSLLCGGDWVGEPPLIGYLTAHFT